MSNLLTQRQTEVLALVAEGAGTAEISERLSISPTTVRSHVTSTCRKLKARNRAQAVARGIAMGLIEVETSHCERPLPNRHGPT